MRNPYKSRVAEAHTTAINILAVEYLIKTNNRLEYAKRIKQVYGLSEIDLEDLCVRLGLNMHTSSLGAMITQGDYDCQCYKLLGFLDSKEEL